MAGSLLFAGVVWGSIAAILGVFGYIGWLLVSVRQ